MRGARRGGAAKHAVKTAVSDICVGGIRLVKWEKRLKTAP